VHRVDYPAQTGLAAGGVCGALPALRTQYSRQRPLEERKWALERLLAGLTGVRLSEHMEGDGPIIFEHACKMGLEGIVSKRRNLPYRSGRVRSWIKVKNPASPAALRIVEEGT
jgi:ATP-dependent DNA ligase